MAVKGLSEKKVKYMCYADESIAVLSESGTRLKMISDCWHETRLGGHLVIEVPYTKSRLMKKEKRRGRTEMETWVSTGLMKRTRWPSDGEAKAEDARSSSASSWVPSYLLRPHVVAHPSGNGHLEQRMKLNQRTRW